MALFGQNKKEWNKIYEDDFALSILSVKQWDLKAEKEFGDLKVFRRVNRHHKTFHNHRRPC